MADKKIYTKILYDLYEKFKVIPFNRLIFLPPNFSSISMSFALPVHDNAETNIFFGCGKKLGSNTEDAAENVKKKDVFM